VTITILAEKSPLKIALLQIDELKPHEQGSPIYLELLKQEILKDQMLKYPIIADEKTRVILDGMHRWLTLKSLGYSLIPVILVDAFQNPKIRVGRRRIHRYINNSDEEISIEEVLQAGTSGRLMKPRSTRHFFPFSKFQLINCPLDQLLKTKPRDVSRYLAKMTIKDCELAIKDWFDEIQEELEFLAKRKKEVEDEMQEFIRAINSNHYTSKFYHFPTPKQKA
jgi:hypothetical protein